MSNVLQKQQHGGSQLKEQPTCLITREANTLRHTQVRTTCVMVATTAKSVKLPIVTKDSKHLVGTSGDDSSALIEFTPL